LEVLFIAYLDFPKVTLDIHSLALLNFRISLGSFNSPSFGTIMYSKINSAVSPDVDARSNLFVL